VSWAKAAYIQVKEFLTRSIKGTQRIDLKAWQIKIEGLVEKPLSLSFDEIQALPRKTQVRNFICVEGWGLDNQKREGVHLKDIFSRVKISPKAKYVTFHATGGKYKPASCIKKVPGGNWVCWRTVTAAPLNVLLLRSPAYCQSHPR